MRQIIIDFGVLHLWGFAIPLRVYGYGLMLILGFIVGITLAQWRARRCGESPEKVSWIGLLTLIGGVVGARLAYVAKNHELFFGPGWSILDIINVSSGGLIYFGGVAGAMILAIGYMVFRKLPVRRYLDIFAVSMMVGLAFGRAGCTLNGCCWGGPAKDDFALAIRFPMYTPPLLKFDGRPDNPFSLRQDSPCPAYAHQYYDARLLQPDERLLNTLATPQAGPRPIHPARYLHGPLDNDQLKTMFGPEDQARVAFETLAGEDRVVTREEWQAGLRDPDGFLRGSEFWDEVQLIQRDPGAPHIDFREAWAYLQYRAGTILQKFDRDADGTLNAEERTAANAYLQADLQTLARQSKTKPLLPAQPLGILNALLLAGLLSLFFRHRTREGQVFVLMLILYPTTRFLLESIRHDDPLNVLHGNWTHNQIHSAIAVVLMLAAWQAMKKLPASCGPTLEGRQTGKP
jgi:prolipoprotein diacylglyceryltransferase